MENAINMEMPLLILSKSINDVPILALDNDEIGDEQK